MTNPFINILLYFQHQYIDWKHTHNVRNFSISQGNIGESGCIWECKDNHIDSIFALTRKVGDVLTCSCAYANAFDFDKMVLPEFCQLNDDQVAKDSSNSDFYHINCVTDLDEGNGILVRKKMFFAFCQNFYQCLVGCVLFSVFEISKTTVGHKCSLVRKAEKWF